MVDFSKITAISKAAGFQYYDVQTFSKTVPGQTIPKASVHYLFYSDKIDIRKNRFDKTITDKILSSVLVRPSDAGLAAGRYFSLRGTYQKNRIIGSAGGFPIFYAISLDVQVAGDFLEIVIEIGNPSAVNNVTVPDITIEGKVFFYLAPF